MENKEKSLEELRLENERLQMEIKRKELELKERELSVLEKKERRTEKIAESVTGAKNIVQRVVPVHLTSYNKKVFVPVQGTKTFLQSGSFRLQ